MNRSDVTTGCLLVLSCFLATSIASDRTIYVDDDAAGANDGSSWAHAYTFLQDALADANRVEKPVEIRVAQGLYKPDRGAGRKQNEPKETFQLINGVMLKGGYMGLTGVDPDVRDVQLCEAILSGDLADDDPDVNDPWNLRSAESWNSHTVVTGSGTDRTAVLDGFTITGGRYPMMGDRINPNNPPRPTGSGGGMNNLDGSPTVIECTFLGNMSHGVGGGICNQGQSCPRVVDCAFVRNYAYGGGAVANSGDSAPAFVRCAFTENSALDKGGAVYNRTSSPTLDACTFTRNSTHAQYSGNGGAVYAEESTCTLTDCAFAENKACAGGVLYSHANSSLLFERCTLIGNLADIGGVLAGWGSNNSFVVNACVFGRNSARGSGGAMYLSESVQVSNCIFSGNTSGLLGGAVTVPGGTFTNCFFVGNRALDGFRSPGETRIPGMGGAVSHLPSMEALRFINCTFDENRASLGSAVCTHGWPDFRSCILRGPAPLIRSDPDEPPPSVTYSNVESPWPGEGNMDVDPAFAERGYWADPSDRSRPGDANDPNAVWMDGDYHVKSRAGRWDPVSESWVQDEVASPCIDAGDPNAPVGDEPEPNGGRINMGAYGGTAEASKS